MNLQALRADLQAKCDTARHLHERAVRAAAATEREVIRLEAQLALVAHMERDGDQRTD